MQQVVALHGAESFATYEEFWKALGAMALHLERIKFRDWKSNLEGDLGDSYEVILPRMPNSLNAKYREWKLWFEKLLPQLEDELILVGHSMGGVFIAKYLSEERVQKTIRASFLVAAPFDCDRDRPLHEFAIVNDLTMFRTQGGHIFLYQSADDPVVEPAEVQKYRTLLPDATERIFSDREHFNQEHLPELVEDIHTVTNLPS